MQIRPVRTHEEYRIIVEIQKAVWRFPDREVVPVNELIITQKIGGAVLGAFDKNRMVGFCFSAIGFDKHGVYHHSRMLGVLPEYQDKGVGFRLKCAQREHALRQGLDLIQWTFDPLQSRNAYFNIAKLGCVITTYWVNLYGTSSSAFNRGLETDRFAPEWRIRSRRVQARLQGTDRMRTFTPDEVMNETRPNSKGQRQTFRLRKRYPPRRCAIEIPSNIDALKEKDLTLAREWRRITRGLFTGAFKNGWSVMDFALSRESGGVRSFYILEKP